MEHKYGFHVNRTGADVLDAIRRLQPTVIKSVEHDVGFWKEVRILLPDAFLIGRLVVTPEEQDQFDQDPAGTARAFAERILRLEANETSVQGRRLFDAWESYNEVMSGGASADRKRKYDDFQVAFAEPIRQAVPVPNVGKLARIFHPAQPRLGCQRDCPNALPGDAQVIDDVLPRDL